MDTHEHLLGGEQDWINKPPNVLNDMFSGYAESDLRSAGASDEVIALKQRDDVDIRERFEAIRQYWESIRHAGFGEAASIVAERFYGLKELTADGLAQAQETAAQWHKPGQRLHILKEMANLDHVQIDDLCYACVPDESGPEFFLYDLSWWSLSCGEMKVEDIHKETQVTVSDLATLQTAIDTLFTRYGPCAIAVKTQHAYFRTLQWKERSDDEAEHALKVVLARGEDAPEEYRLCLGDWCIARGVEKAVEYNLPFKIHTGYYAGNNRMPVDYIKSGNLCGLLARYPEARFVLMHIAYPYRNELVALAKHYTNVWVDLCWAWAIDPYSSCDFVRRFIHAVPANKLFAFGGDTMRPTTALAFSVQARLWLTRALQAEVDEGYLSEKQAIALASKFMRENQQRCFDLEGTRAAIKEKLSASCQI